MIENIDQLRDAIGAVVAYNWADEEHDYEECASAEVARETGENSREGHIFLTLRNLAEWLGEKVDPLPDAVSGPITDEMVAVVAEWLGGGTGWARDVLTAALVDPSHGTQVAVASAREADEALATGKTRPMSEVLAEESAAPTLEERVADSFFFDWPGGTVPEELYQEVLGEVKRSANHLRSETCWRVELSHAEGSYDRVNWYETTKDDTVENIEATYLPPGAGSAYIVSCRRATVEEDLEEIVEEIAHELGWEDKLAPPERDAS